MRTSSIVTGVIAGIFVFLATVATRAQDNVYPGGSPKPRYTLQDPKHPKQVFGESHYVNHPDYSTWYIPRGDGHDGTTSCCNDQDCDIVKAWRDEHDRWIVEYVSPRTGHIFHLEVEGFRMLREKDDINKFKKSPDGNSHACITETIIDMPALLCFVAGDIKS